VFLGILLSCLTLFEASVLTWHPAGVVHATCMREGPISQPGGWSGDFWPLGLALSQCGHVFANSVRYTYKCFTRKYTTRKIQTNLHTGPEWRIFRLTTKNIADAIFRYFTVVSANNHASVKMANNWLVCIIKRKWHGGSKIWFYFLFLEEYFTHSLRSLINIVFALENKSHIFTPLCKILYQSETVSLWESAGNN